MNMNEPRAEAFPTGHRDGYLIRQQAIDHFI